jgi:hypothetical protein
MSAVHGSHDFCDVGGFHLCAILIQAPSVNNHYSYARCGHDYEKYPDAIEELAAIRARLAPTTAGIPD